MDYLVLDSPFSTITNYNKLIRQNIVGYKLVDSQSAPGADIFFYKNAKGEELYISYNVPVMYRADLNISHYGIGRIFFRGNLPAIFNLFDHLGNSKITLDEIKKEDHLNHNTNGLYSHTWLINYKGNTTKYCAYIEHFKNDQSDYWILKFDRRYVDEN